MKALAWVAVALLQIGIVKLNLLDFLSPVATFFYERALHMMERHPSRWIWFYEAILIGREEGLRSQPGLQAFFTLGLYHLIVVSGSHVLALEKILEILTTRFSKNFRRGIVIAGLILFSLVNRLQASCVRAVVSWFLSRQAVVKPHVHADIQLLVTCLCLIFEPQWASSLSFQLSCGATLGLAIAGSLSFRKPWVRRLSATALCTLTTAPLVFSLQSCLSWIIIPANTVGMPLFEGILMPISLFNVFFHRGATLTEPIFDFIFGLCEYAATFDHPFLCLDERRLKTWGLIYLAFVYFGWRWVWPFCLRWQFTKTQDIQKTSSFFGT